MWITKNYSEELQKIHNSYGIQRLTEKNHEHEWNYHFQLNNEFTAIIIMFQ